MSAIPSTAPATDDGTPARSRALRHHTWVGPAATLVSVAPILLMLTVLVVAQGSSPLDALDALLRGSVGSADALSRTIHHALPLVVVALGASVAARAGLLNIGQEGQVMLGGLAAAAVGLKLQLPLWILVILALVVATAIGACWAGVAAVLRAWRGIDEVIGTLLLSFIAVQIVSYALNQDWLLKSTGDQSAQTIPRTNPLPKGFSFPDLPAPFGVHLDLGLLLAVAALLAVPLLLSRTIWGFRLRTLGLGPDVARRVGVKAKRYAGYGLVISGALAGLAGAMVVLGGATRFNSTTTVNVGWEGVLVALMARERAAYIVPSALLFGALASGSGSLLATGIPSSLTAVAEGGFVLAAIAAPVVARELRGRFVAVGPVYEDPEQ